MPEEKTAFIWRASVYNNNFKCSHCGTVLFDPEAENPTENLGTDPEDPQAKLYCMKCQTVVGVMRPYHGDDTGPLLGEWEGDL